MNDLLHAIQTSDITYRLGWMLLHSLWLGAGVAAALALLLAILRERAATVRYGVACAALVLLLAGMAATYRFIPAQASLASTPTLSDSPHAAPPAVPLPRNAMPPLRPAHAPPDSPRLPEPREPLAIQTEKLLTSAIPWLVPAWAAGVLLLSIWHVSAWIAARRLCTVATQPAESAMLDRVERLKTRLGIRRRVKVLRSMLAQVPMTIGSLKPVILFPAALSTGLSTSQLEMLLVHELAHIRRWDYLVNLLQTFIETVMFYHPAVWYISRRIRAEREHACDELVVAICGKRQEYADALVACSGAAGRVALAASAGNLLPRLKRILGVSPERRMTRTVAGAVVAMTLVMAVIAVPLACSSAHQKTTSPRSVRFDLGDSQFLPGDNITITEIIGTSDTIAPVNTYQVKGNYTLASHDHARLSVYVTSADANDTHHDPMDNRQTIFVDKGSGNFTVVLPFLSKGYPHLSFYPLDSEPSFSSLYFGTGDSLLKTHAANRPAANQDLVAPTAHASEAAARETALKVATQELVQVMEAVRNKPASPEIDQILIDSASRHQKALIHLEEARKAAKAQTAPAEKSRTAISHEYYVGGEVAKKGTYYLPEKKGLTVLRALVSAQFKQDQKDLVVRVWRRDEKGRESAFEIKVADLIARTVKDPDLEADDVLLVADSRTMAKLKTGALLEIQQAAHAGENGEVYVMGKVARPGIYSASQRKLTVKQMLTGAGISIDDLAKVQLQLIRREGDKEEHIFRLNPRKLFDGEEADRFLEPNDLLNVQMPAETPPATTSAATTVETKAPAPSPEEPGGHLQP